MTKEKALFGKYLKSAPKDIISRFTGKAIHKVMPVKSLGRIPSYKSQQNLWGGDDINWYFRKTPRLGGKIFVQPEVIHKKFYSPSLGSFISGISVSRSALYEIDSAGGFDNYITQTPPEHLRSSKGDQLNRLMRWLEVNPQAEPLSGLWKPMLLDRNQKDVDWTKLRHHILMTRNTDYNKAEASKNSVYFLPKNPVQSQINKKVRIKLSPSHAGYTGSKDMTMPQPISIIKHHDPTKLRQILSQARGVERIRPNSSYLYGFSRGGNMGGGGRQRRQYLHRQGWWRAKRFASPLFREGGKT